MESAVPRGASQPSAAPTVEKCARLVANARGEALRANGGTCEGRPVAASPRRAAAPAPPRPESRYVMRLDPEVHEFVKSLSPRAGGPPSAVAMRFEQAAMQ